MKIVVFCLKFHWNIFTRVQLTIIHHWFRWWLDAKQATSHYQNQWWSSFVTHICISRPQWVNDFEYSSTRSNNIIPESWWDHKMLPLISQRYDFCMEKSTCLITMIISIWYLSSKFGVHSPQKLHGIHSAFLFSSVGSLTSIEIQKKEKEMNSSPPSAAYMSQWIRSALVQIMAWHLFSAKPLSEPMLGYCQLDPWQQTSVKF